MDKLFKIVHLGIISLVVAGSLTLVSGTNTAAAASSDAAKRAVCQGLGAADPGASDCEDPAGSSSVDGTVVTVINLLSLVVGVVSVIMVIVGGLKYVTSQGESAGTAGAKNTIIYAIVGLVVVALAQLIVRFVVKNITEDAPAATQ